MRKALVSSLALIAVLALVGAPAAFAKPGPGQGHGHEEGGGPPTGYGHDGSSGGRGGPGVQFRIGGGDLSIFRDYYNHHRYKPKRLPPGIAKNLARGKPLPPGIAKRYAPRDLVARLPPRAGCDWLLVGPNIVLVQRGSGLVVDIAFDFFR